jgi:hypothetical protein
MSQFVIPERTGDAVGGDSAGLRLAATPWPETHPYAPSVLVQADWTAESLRLRYAVREQTVRAIETDPWLVHLDSCVELFFRLPGEEAYYNFESNPCGCFLLALGPGRHNREDLTAAATGAIEISGSHVGQPPFAERDDVGIWDLTVELPTRSVRGLDAWGPRLVGLTANVYKCGDALSQPHYLAWRAPRSERPDYHRPESFGAVTFR